AVEAPEAGAGLGLVERDGRDDHGVSPGPLQRFQVGGRAGHRPLAPAEHAARHDRDAGDGDERTHHPRVAATASASCMARSSSGAGAAGSAARRTLSTKAPSTVTPRRWAKWSLSEIFRRRAPSASWAQPGNVPPPAA